MSQSCEFLTTGYTLSCLDSTPGVKNIYLANIDNVTGFTLSSGNVITGITMQPATFFYRFQSPKFTASFEETINLNEENGVFSVTPTIAFRLLKRTTALRDMLLKVGKSKLLAIVENQDGRYWLVGATTPTSPQNDNGLVASEGSLTSGVARDDFAGLNLTLTGYQDVPSYEISSGIIAGITTT
jgi:hypothetical protein